MIHDLIAALCVLAAFAAYIFLGSWVIGAVLYAVMFAVSAVVSWIGNRRSREQDK